MLGEETSIFTLVALYFHDRRGCLKSSWFFTSWFVSNRWSLGISRRSHSSSSMVSYYSILGKRWCRIIFENGMLVHPGCLRDDCINTEEEEPRLLESNSTLFGTSTSSWRKLCSWNWSRDASGWNHPWFCPTDLQGEESMRMMRSSNFPTKNAEVSEQSGPVCLKSAVILICFQRLQVDYFECSTGLWQLEQKSAPPNRSGTKKITGTKPCVGNEWNKKILVRKKNKTAITCRAFCWESIRIFCQVFFASKLLPCGKKHTPFSWNESTGRRISNLRAPSRSRMSSNTQKTARWGPCLLCIPSFSWRCSFYLAEVSKKIDPRWNKTNTSYFCLGGGCAVTWFSLFPIWNPKTTIYKWLAVNWMMNHNHTFTYRKWLEITKHPFINGCLKFGVPGISNSSLVTGHHLSISQAVRLIPWSPEAQYFFDLVTQPTYPPP